MEDDDEPVCVCEQHEAVCGSDGVTYMNMCQLREAAFSKPGLRTEGEGPCKTGRSPVYLSTRDPHCVTHSRSHLRVCSPVVPSTCLSVDLVSGSHCPHTCSECVFTCLTFHTARLFPVTCLSTHLSVDKEIVWCLSHVFDLKVRFKL